MSEEVQEVITQEVVVDQNRDQVEREARQFGWVPKEEFRGSEESWVDAEVFVQRGKEINPILRKNNERLMKELEHTRKQMESLRETTEEFKQFQKEVYERKVVEMESQIRVLREQKKEAIKSGDGDLAVDIDEQIDALKEEKAAEVSRAQEQSKKTAQVEEQQQLPPEVEEWVGRNSWYSKDTGMRMATDAIATALHNANPFLQGQAFFDALDKELEKTFAADKLGRKTKPRSPVESGSTSTSRTTQSKKSYESLPADAKVACDKFVKQGLMTKEEYVASYDW